MFLALFALALLPSSVASLCHSQSSQLYIDALYAKNPVAAAAIPLHDDVVRYEGPPGLLVQTAINAASLRLSTYAGASSFFLTGDGPTSSSTSDVNDTTTLIDYTSGAGVAVGDGVELTSARIVEYFTFDGATDCDIQRIEATFYVGGS